MDCSLIPKNIRDLPALSVFRQRIRKLDLNSLYAYCFDCIFMSYIIDT